MKGYHGEGWFSMSLHRTRGDGDLTSDLSKMAGKGKQSYMMFMEMQNLCPSLGVSIGVVVFGRNCFRTNFDFFMFKIGNKTK